MSCIRNFRCGIMLSVLLLVFVSCFGDKSAKKIKAGVVNYNISWNTGNSSSVKIMPKTLKLLYSDKGYCIEFEKMFSFIEMRVVHEFGKDTMNYILDMAGIGSYFGYPINNLRTNLDDLEFEMLKERRSILNYSCNVIEYYTKDSKSKIKLYYTRDLNIDVVNKVVPHIKTKGAILGVYISQGKDEIYLEATSVNVTDVDSNLFIVPKDFIKNSYKQMTKTFESIAQ